MTDPDLAALTNISTDHLTDEEIEDISRRLDAAAHALVPGRNCAEEDAASPPALEG